MSNCLSALIFRSSLPVQSLVHAFTQSHTRISSFPAYSSLPSCLTAFLPLHLVYIASRLLHASPYTPFLLAFLTYRCYNYTYFPPSSSFSCLPSSSRVTVPSRYLTLTQCLLHALPTYRCYSYLHIYPFRPPSFHRQQSPYLHIILSYPHAFSTPSSTHTC